MANETMQTTDSITATEADSYRRHGSTLGVTQMLEQDILHFLSSKYTTNATLTLEEIKEFYDCPDDRARRVVSGLKREGVLKEVESGVYKVTI